MRGRCPAMILVLVLAACGSSSAASEKSATSPTTRGPATCGPRAARTLAAGPRARVYVVNDEVYGCAAGGRSYRLGAGARVTREDRVGPVAVAGEDAGYGLSRFGVDTVSAEVLVRDLADGRLVQEAAATSRILVESFESVDSVVVKPDGAAAWISEVGSVIARKRYVEVHRIDARGPALLDSGSGIVGRSLRRHGSTVTWRDGSGTRSATLR